MYTRKAEIRLLYMYLIKIKIFKNFKYTRRYLSKFFKQIKIRYCKNGDNTQHNVINNTHLP